MAFPHGYQTFMTDIFHIPSSLHPLTLTLSPPGRGTQRQAILRNRLINRIPMGTVLSPSLSREGVGGGLKLGQTRGSAPTNRDPARSGICISSDLWLLNSVFCPSHSYRNASTGFAIAALIACTLTVASAITKVSTDARRKIPYPMLA